MKTKRFSINSINTLSIAQQETFFRDMAREGYFPEKKILFLHFRKGEAKDTIYRVIASEETNLTIEKKRFFEEAGWHLVMDYEPYLLFEVDKESVDEFYSTPEEFSEALERIAKKRKTAFIITCVMFIGVFGIILWDAVLIFRTNDFGVHNFNISLYIIWLFAFLQQYNSLRDYRTIQKNLEKDLEMLKKEQFLKHDEAFDLEKLDRITRHKQLIFFIFVIMVIGIYLC